MSQPSFLPHDVRSRGATVVHMCALVALTAASWGTVLPASAQDFEDPPVFEASRILAPDLLIGAEHQVDERVENDGYMNRYRIHSRFGAFDAQSTAELAIRVREIYAMAKMSELQSSDVFVSAMKKTGSGVVTGVTGIISDPGGSISGAASGVGKLFKRAGAKLAGDPRSESEGSSVSDLIGLENRKREYAADFGVDVYSSNEAMQAQLDRIAAAGYFGGMSTSLAVGAVAGPILTVTGGVDLMGDVFRSTSATDLRLMNREKLASMGVSPDVIDLFIGDRVFSPRHQTLLVAALAQMDGVDGRAHFVKFAVGGEGEDLALFRQRQAQMYAGYHRAVEPIVEFVPFGALVGARTKSGKTVFNAPLDHIAWTSEMSRFLRWADGQVLDAEGKGAARELWITGTMSALAKRRLSELGWTVRENATALVSSGGG